MIRYFEQYWMEKVNPATFSIYKQTHRTNNAAENFNKKLKSKMGTHPNLGYFYVCLLSLIILFRFSILISL